MLTFLRKIAGFHSAVDSASGCRSRGRKFESQLIHITFMEYDNEIISKILILSLPLFQKVTSESKCTSTGKPLGGLLLPRKNVSRFTAQLEMTLTVLTGS